MRAIDRPPRLLGAGADAHQHEPRTDPRCGRHGHRRVRSGTRHPPARWSLSITTAIGFAVGFRIHGSLSEALAAFGLCMVLGFRVRARVGVALHRPRHVRRVGAGCPGPGSHGLSTDLRIERVRADRDDARVDAGHRGEPADHAHGRCRPSAHAESRGGSRAGPPSQLLRSRARCSGRRPSWRSSHPGYTEEASPGKEWVSTTQSVRPPGALLFGGVRVDDYARAERRCA